MDFDMEYRRYCMHGHEWMDCTCYEPDCEEDRIVTMQPSYSCSCVGVYDAETEETIRVQCESCREGAYITHILSNCLNSINVTNDIEEKISLIGYFFRYVYTVDDFLSHNMTFAYSLYEKCQELEDNPKCESILMYIRIVKRLIERL
jgi:hypothetical protein